MRSRGHRECLILDSSGLLRGLFHSNMCLQDSGKVGFGQCHTRWLTRRGRISHRSLGFHSCKGLHASQTPIAVYQSRVRIVSSLLKRCLKDAGKCSLDLYSWILYVDPVCRHSEESVSKALHTTEWHDIALPTVKRENSICSMNNMSFLT